MLKIYGVYRSRASRNIWLANELGLPFEHVPVIQVYRLPQPVMANAPINTQSPAFLAVNPNGQIPAVADGDLVLTQSLGINLYLAKKHGGPLGPANMAEDGQMTQWTLWAATDVETHALNILYHRIGKPPAERDEQIALTAIDTLKPRFAVLEAHLAATGCVVGSRFTVADLNLAEVFRYAQAAPELYAGYPNISRWITACQARPAFKAMLEKRNAEPA